MTEKHPSAAAAPTATPASTEAAGVRPARSRRATGIGRVLVVVYGILALAALGRSTVQIIERFDEAPAAFTLSALSALVYVLATIALVAPGRTWYRIAWGTLVFELAGVLVVGTLTLVVPELLGHGVGDPFGRTSTVWAVYGMGYLFIPLVLPMLGMWWLATHRPDSPAAAPAAAVRGAAE